MCYLKGNGYFFSECLVLFFFWKDSFVNFECEIWICVCGSWNDYGMLYSFIFLIVIDEREIGGRFIFCGVKLFFLIISFFLVVLLKF